MRTHTNCWFCFYLFCSLWHVSYGVVAPHQFPSPKWLYTLLTAFPNLHATVKYTAWYTVPISWNLTHSFEIPLRISLFIGLMFLDCSNSRMVGSNSALGMEVFQCGCAPLCCVILWRWRPCSASISDQRVYRNVWRIPRSGINYESKDTREINLQYNPWLLKKRKCLSRTDGSLLK